MAKMNVEYSRLFNIGEYENEKIGFLITDVEEENADKQLGEFFMKVIDVEKMLQRYRRALGSRENRWHHFENAKRNVRLAQTRIEEKKIRIGEIAELLEKQKIDRDEAIERKLKNACDAHSIRQLKEQLENSKKQVAGCKVEYEEACRIQQELEKRINNGNWSLEGIEKPKYEDTVSPF